MTAVKRNTSIVRRMDAEIADLLEKTTSIRLSLARFYGEALAAFDTDYLVLPASRQDQLVALVNNTKACAALLGKRLEQSPDFD